MKNRKKIKLLKKRVEALEVILTKNSLCLQNPEDENSFLKISIRDNEFIVEGVSVTTAQSESVIFPITNQKIKD